MYAIYKVIKGIFTHQDKPLYQGSKSEIKIRLTYDPHSRFKVTNRSLANSKDDAAHTPVYTYLRLHEVL